MLCEENTLKLAPKETPSGLKSDIDFNDIVCWKLLCNFAGNLSISMETQVVPSAKPNHHYSDENFNERQIN